MSQISCEDWWEHMITALILASKSWNHTNFIFDQKIIIRSKFHYFNILFLLRSIALLLFGSPLHVFVNCLRFRKRVLKHWNYSSIIQQVWHSKKTPKNPDMSLLNTCRSINFFTFTTTNFDLYYERYQQVVHKCEVEE